MSSFAEKRELKAQIAAAKKAGKSTQTIGRLQYKLNNLTSNSKGSAVKTKSGVVKSKTGVVRTKPTSKKAHDFYKEAVALDKKKPKKKGPDLYKEAVALDKKSKTKAYKVKTTGAPHAKITKSVNPNFKAGPTFNSQVSRDARRIAMLKAKKKAANK